MNPNLIAENESLRSTILNDYGMIACRRHMPEPNKDVYISAALGLLIPWYGGLLTYIEVISYINSKGSLPERYEITRTRVNKYRIWKDGR